MYKFSVSVRAYYISLRRGYDLTTAAGCIAADRGRNEVYILPVGPLDCAFCVDQNVDLGCQAAVARNTLVCDLCDLLEQRIAFICVEGINLALNLIAAVNDVLLTEDILLDLDIGVQFLVVFLQVLAETYIIECLTAERGINEVSKILAFHFSASHISISL